jgi:hypothetical protein
LSKEKSSDLGQKILEVVTTKQPQSIQALLEMLKNDGISEKEALENIERLHAESSLRLEPLPPPPQSLTYKVSSLTWYALTISCSLAAAVLVFVIPPNLYPLAYVRNVFGLAFVFFLPGFALTKAIFWKSSIIRAENKSVENIERTALSFGLSIGVVTILGLFLYYSALGFHFEVIVITLLVFTGFFATLALLLENRTQKRIYS